MTSLSQRTPVALLLAASFCLNQAATMAWGDDPPADSAASAAHSTTPDQSASWGEAAPSAVTESSPAASEKAPAQSSEANPQAITANTAFTADFPDKDWWLKFNDTYLNGYMSEAVQYNPRLEITVHRITQARSQVLESFSHQLPSASLSPGFTRIGLPNNLGLGGALPSAINAFMLAFKPSFELDLFGRNLDRTRSAKRELAAVELDSKTALMALQGEVASAYFNLLRSDVLVADDNKNIALLTRINDLKRNQHEAGLTSYDEVIRSERDVAQALTNLNLHRQEQALFAHQLAVLVGRPPSSESHLERATLAAIALPAQTETGVPSELLTRRPDILASERRLEKAVLDVRVARKAFLPSINLSGQFLTAGQHFKDIFDKDSFVNFESAAINQPIFQGGRLIAGTRFQKARQREQMASYRQTILTAFQEVEDQLAKLKSNYENLNSNGKRLDLTAHSLKITENQQEQGLISKLNVLQAESELLQYRQLSAQSKADVLIATVNLYKALGGGF
jgi:outer membrane protein, multidrug efflux system